MAIVKSNDTMPLSADAYYTFRQNPDIYYLTGIEQEHTSLLLYPNSPVKEWREVLFIIEPKELQEKWEGKKLTKSRATELSGITNVQYIDQLDNMIYVMSNQAVNMYLHINEHSRYNNEVPDADKRQANILTQQYPLHKFERLAPILHHIRSIKEPEEIAAMQMACNITAKAFDRVLEFTKPGVKEFEIEAEIIHEFIRNGSEGHAYNPIIAGGAHATILHYNENEDVCKDGDLILLDFGCRYAGYSSDLSRTIPINGKFTERQKEVYNAVLEVHQFAKSILKVGVIIGEYQKQVIRKMEEVLIRLNLITVDEVNDLSALDPAYRRYFYHGTSHFIGLDVHDVGNFYKPVQAGMVFTIEPGIYIAEEKLGIRIENNYLITNDGSIDLMENIPITVEAIEAKMNGI